MKIDQIIVVKETREGEGRVALTPRIVAQLIEQGYKVSIEEDAGLKAGFTNEEYTQVGAKLFLLGASGFPPNTFIIRVLRPSKERELIENKLFHTNTAMLGFLFPFVADNHIATWQTLGLTTLSFDLFKSLSIHDPKNAQAAMSKIAGRLSFHDALKHYSGKNPAKLMVIGAGAAGLSAAHEAVKCGVPVQLLGRHEHLRSELEDVGISFCPLPQSEQISFIKNYLSDKTLVITAARTSGKKAPILLDEESLTLLPHHAVVVDLAISNGGNVVGSKHDHVISVANGVSIVNISGYPKTEPRSSSEAYAQCAYSLLTAIMTPDGKIDFENKLIQEIWVTHDRERNDSLYDDFEESKPLGMKL